MRLLFLLAAAFAPFQGAAAPRIEADHYADEFGTVYRGEQLHSKYTIVNRGDADLVIEKISNSCQCSASRFTIDGRSWEESELPSAKQLGVLSPGEEAQLEVTTRTAAATTPGDETAIRKAIRIHSNDPARPTLSLALNATMISPFTLEPARLDFGVVRKGAGAKRSAVIWSDLLGEFLITGAKTPDPGSLAVKTTRLETKPGLPPTWQIDAELLPSAPIGVIAGHLELSVDHPRVKEIHVEVRFEVEPAVAFLDNKPDTTEQLDFGILTTGKATTIELAIENSDPRVPYLLQKAEVTDCRPSSEGFVAEIVEVEKGMKYVVKLTAPATLGKVSYFLGNLLLTADHPDLPLRKVRFRGWYKSGDKGAP